MNILLRRHGRWLEVGTCGPNNAMQPLPAGYVSQHLLNALSYTYSYCERDGGTITSGVQTVTRLRAMWSPHGTLFTGIGCLSRLANEVVPQMGCRPMFQDVTPPLPRPNCYDTDWEAVRRKFQFRPRQEDCLMAIANAQYGMGGVIDATMGFGKTALFKMLAVLYPRAKIAIVVAGAEIVPQIYRGLLQHISSVGKVTGKGKRKGRVTVYTADSFHHCDNDIDILLGDEAHELVTEGRSAKFSHLRHARAFLFSGSVDDRMDGLQARLEPMSGPVIFQLTYQEGVQLGLVVPMQVIWLPIDMYEDPTEGKGGIIRKRKGIWRNTVRNRAIANFIHANFQQDEQILISVDTFEHAIFLNQLLPDFALAYATADLKKVARYKEWGLLPQDWHPMDHEQRDRLRNAFTDGQVRRVIATSVWSRGVSFDGLSVMVRGDGGMSGVKDKQWPGRASRIADGKMGSIIVDCADKFNPRLWEHSLARYRHYQALGWTQHWPYRTRGRRATA